MRQASRITTTPSCIQRPRAMIAQHNTSVRKASRSTSSVPSPLFPCQYLSPYMPPSHAHYTHSNPIPSQPAPIRFIPYGPIADRHPPYQPFLAQHKPSSSAELRTMSDHRCHRRSWSAKLKVRERSLAPHSWRHGLLASQSQDVSRLEPKLCAEAQRGSWSRIFYGGCRWMKNARP